VAGHGTKVPTVRRGPVLRDQARLAFPATASVRWATPSLPSTCMVDVLQRRDRADDRGEILPEARAAPPPHRMARSASTA
jgi:hypothetical protein